MKCISLQQQIKTLLAASAMAALASAQAAAQEKVTLKFADWMPLSHYTVENAAKPFMEKAKALSDGRIDIQYFPGEQLGKAKDALTLVQSGVADIVDISPSYITDKFVLSSVAELPAMFSSACEGTEAVAALVEGDGMIARNEFTPQGVRVLVSVAYAPYKVLTVANAVDEVGDFEGLKLRTAGGAMDITASQLGAISVRMPGPDILPSLSRGTLDGTLAPLQSVEVFDLQTVLKHMTTDVSLGSFVTVYAISDRAWQSLGADLQKALSEAGDFATRNHCEYVDGAEKKVIAKLEGDGVKANTMKPGQLAALEKELADVQEKWAATLDERERPGSEVLEAFRQQVGRK